MKQKNLVSMKNLVEKTNFENLSVALLLSDIEDGQNVSEVFREMGIIPHYYETLQSFWKGILNKMPSLAIIDVKLMSEGERLLRNHPFVKTQQLPISFFYSDLNAPLVYSTFEILNYGLIRKETNLRGQLKGMLRRFNHSLEVDIKEKSFEIQMQKMERQVTSLITASEKLKEDDYYKNFLDSIISKFENRKGTEDFYELVSIVFSSVKEVKEWSLLELNKNGQRLVSPALETDKFKEIPSLWLGQPCKEGIQVFAQNLASQVGVDLLGGELMSLMIKGKHDLPDKIILIRCENESFLNQLDWEGLERYLSGLHSRYLLREVSAEKIIENSINPYELFQMMDHFNFDGPMENDGEDKYLIVIELLEMFQFIKSKPTIRFYWNDFFKDFFYRFENQHKISLKISNLSIGHIAVLVKSENKERIFRALKAYVSRFPYWKYFEDIDIVMVREIPPKIKMIHYSSDAVFSMLSEKNESFFVGQTKKGPSQQGAKESALSKKSMDNLKEGFFLNFEQERDL